MYNILPALFAEPLVKESLQKRTSTAPCHPNNFTFALMNAKGLSIELKGVSKKFGSNWIFRNINARFEAGNKYAITGPNGSGKSTLLKIVAGMVTPNAGGVSLVNGGQAIATEDWYPLISFCAPFMELPDELTLVELLDFHESQRKMLIGRAQLMQEVQLDAGKEIRNYSSGMKQRLKLALAFYTDSPIVLLDEPTNTLDAHWTDWYFKLAGQLSAGRLVIISSNIPTEFSFCNSVLDIEPYTR